MKRPRPYLLVALLMAFWVVLTGSLDPVELALGLAASAATAFGVWHLLGAESQPLIPSARQATRFLIYLPYLIKEIIVANIDVAEKVLDPRLPISPIVVRCEYRFEHEISVVALANSITLTPGTLTVDIDQDGAFYVHCLARDFVPGIVEGELYRHIRHVFEEE